MKAPDCCKCELSSFERWPKGAAVTKCVNPKCREWSGRVVDYSTTGEFVEITAPAWCARRAEMEA